MDSAFRQGFSLLNVLRSAWLRNILYKPNHQSKWQELSIVGHCEAYFKSKKQKAMPKERLALCRVALDLSNIKSASRTMG